jgi:predicted MFS family arabinose efflux permease
MSQSTLSPAVPRVSQTALLLAVCAAILSICTGLRQSFGLFLQPMTALGISASEFSLAMAMQSIIWGISAPFIGILADRFGTRPVVATSALVFASGLLVMGSATGTLGLFIGTSLLIGVGIGGTGVSVIMGAVSRAVAPERRSKVIGTVAAAGSIGTFVLAPLGQWFIADGSGWRSALVVFAVSAATMAILALGIGDASRHGTAAGPTHVQDQSVRQMLHQVASHRGFLAMTTAFFACGFQLMFITVHLPSYLTVCGMPPSLGGAALGIIGVCNAVGTYVVGVLGARYSQKRILALLYLLRTVSISAFVLVPLSPTSTLIFATAVGLLWLGVVPLVSGLISKVFGLAHFSLLYGIVFFSHQVGAFGGAMLGGLVFDWTGSYGPGWFVLIGIGLTAFMLQWQMDDRPPATQRLEAARAN